jgi:hypothetical protein
MVRAGKNSATEGPNPKIAENPDDAWSKQRNHKQWRDGRLGRPAYSAGYTLDHLLHATLTSPAFRASPVW